MNDFLGAAKSLAGIWVDSKARVAAHRAGEAETATAIQVQPLPETPAPKINFLVIGVALFILSFAK